MNITRIIFDYWKIWMRQPNEFPVHTEGVYFPSHSEYPIVQFWWVLNISWYQMNNKSLPYTWAENPTYKVPFVCPKDFEGVL